MEKEEEQHLLDLASVGSEEATISLFDFYHQNNEDEKAFNLLIRLNTSTNILILRKLASVYKFGIGTEKNLQEAIKYYNLAFEQDDYLSGFNLALIYYQKHEFEKALPYLLIGANNNHIQSLKMLAEFYYKGIAVVQDLEVSLNFYKKLFSFNEPKTSFMIGKILIQLNREEEALPYLNFAKQENDMRTYAYLADLYLLGKGVEQNYNEAINLLNYGIEQDNIPCLLKLAKLYENGIGVPKDLEKSKELINKIEKLKE